MVGAAALVEDRPAPALSRRFTVRSWRGYAGIGTVTVGSLAFYLFHAFADQARYLTTGYDLGIFDQAVRAYAHFRAPLIPLKGPAYNIFGDHFHPIIAVLAPLYWIWDDVGMLLIAQAVLTAAAIPVVYRFTRRRASEPMSLLVAAAFGFGWPLQSLIDFDFHEIAFATPLMALAIDALDRRDDRRLVLWCALLLFVREDMGLMVALFGVLVLAQRRGRGRLGACLIGVGALMYGLTTQVIIPHFAAGHQFAYGNQFGALGPTLASALGNIVTHPWHAVNVFFTPELKSQTMALLFLPLLFLPLRSPYWLLSVPLLAERFFNSRSNLWSANFHYNALPWVILTLAMVDGAARFGLFRPERRAVLLRRGLAVVLVAFPFVLILASTPWKVVPITSLRKPYANQPSNWLSAAEATVAWLPKDVCVVADNHLVPHLTGRDYTAVAQADIPDPDFIALDLFAPDTGGNPPAPEPYYVYGLAVDSGYHVVFTDATFVILQSPHYRGPSSQCAPLGSGKPVAPSP
jgi:uncharacterized membrane protein